MGIQLFFEDAPGKKGTYVEVDKNDIVELKTAICGLPSTSVAYTQVDTTELTKSLAGVMGIDQAELQKQFDAERAEIIAISEAKVRAAEEQMRQVEKEKRKAEENKKTEEKQRKAEEEKERAKIIAINEARVRAAQEQTRQV